MTFGFDKRHLLNADRRPVLATIATANFDHVIKAYQDVLGYKVLNLSTLSAEEASHWKAPSLETARQAFMGPESGAPVYLRFVEIVSVNPKSLSCGWFALEICVRDVEALYRRLVAQGDFKAFAEPKPMPHTDRVYPMQCRGPAGEILFLNQVRGSLPEIDLPIASSDVDHLFIAILSAPDMQASITFYEDLLDMKVNEKLEFPYKTINRVHGLPLDTPHKLTTLGGMRQVALEIDQYPRNSGIPVSLKSDDIREGILMVSFTVEDFRAEITKNSEPHQSLEAAPYTGAESLICFGPGGERVELIKLPNKKADAE